MRAILRIFFFGRNRGHDGKAHSGRGLAGDRGSRAAVPGGPDRTADRRCPGLGAGPPNLAVPPEVPRRRRSPDHGGQGPLGALPRSPADLRGGPTGRCPRCLRRCRGAKSYRRCPSPPPRSVNMSASRWRRATRSAMTARSWIRTGPARPSISRRRNENTFESSGRPGSPGSPPAPTPGRS